MAFNKCTPQAQKGKAKRPVAGKKTLPQKNPALDEQDDDLDEEDDEDLDFDDDSDLSGADEDLEDEEVDDEELDDEEDDEDEGSEDEEAPAGTAHEQQGTPGRAAVNGKRKADDQPGPSSPKRVCLQDHIPANQVIDYEARDLCDVKLSNFAPGVTEEDVKNLCTGAVEVRPRQSQNKLACAFVRYADKTQATAAAQTLKGAKLKGQPFTVHYCGTRWADPATRPQQLTNTLDVRGLPKSLQDKKKLADFYPTGQVVKVFSDGYAQVRFPTTDALINAVKEPSGRTVGDSELRLSIAIDFKDKKSKRRAAKKPPPSTKAAQKANRAKQTPKGRSPGQKGTPGTKGSPKAAQQQKGKSPGQQKSPAKKASPKTPAQQASPKTPGNQKGPKTPGQAKSGAATPKRKKGTPYPKKIPKGTPGNA